MKHEGRTSTYMIDKDEERENKEDREREECRVRWGDIAERSCKDSQS